MKHNIKITAILLSMFLVTQLIGIYVVDFYSPTKIVDGNQTNVSAGTLPYGFEPPELNKPSEFIWVIPLMILAFVIAISLLLFLTRLNAVFFLKLWFFIVIIAALGISFNAFFPEIQYKMIIIFFLTLPLAFIKIYRHEFFVHNFTELLIYPGIAAIFVPMLNIYTISFLLVLISGYDMWAVWRSGLMQKMAKYQIESLNIFSGFFIPYVSKKVKMSLKRLKKSELRKKKIKVNVAILGGGDVVFPIITAGVMLKEFGFVNFAGFNLPMASLFVILGAAIGLGSLFLFSEKKKFYPAMPFITAGIFAGILLSYLIL
jgi:presenilin-like A22 family membrane protease